MEDFLKGTSVVVSLPTLLYVGLAHRRNRISLLETSKTPELESFLSVPYEFLPLAISLVYGIAYSFLNKERDDPNKIVDKRALVVGSLTGLFLSLVGRFGLGLPSKMFGLPQGKEYTVHIVAPVLYMLIFVYVAYLAKSV